MAEWIGEEVNAETGVEACRVSTSVLIFGRVGGKAGEECGRGVWDIGKCEKEVMALSRRSEGGCPNTESTSLGATVLARAM
jgi:hypothetical protein